MPLHTITSRLVTDGDCQSVKIGLIRLISITTKVRITGLTNVTTLLFDGEFFVQDSAQAHTTCETMFLPVTSPLCSPMLTRNLSGDEIPNVNFFYNDIFNHFTQCAPEATELSCTVSET